MSNKNINLYVDSLIVESVLSNKYAQQEVSQSFIGSIKNYFDSKIDENNKVGSVLQLLVPGAITALFSALGFPKIGFLFAIAQQVFKIDILGAIGSIISELTQKTSSGKQITSQDVSQTVSNSIDSKKQNLSSQDEQVIQQKLQEVKSSNKFQDARIVKLALISYEEGNFNKFAALALGLQSRIISILKSVVSWIFTIALASAGAIVISDGIHSLLGTSSKFLSNKIPNLHSLDIPKKEQTPISVSKQSVFPLNKSYDNRKFNASSSWSERVMNNNSSISNMIIQFAKEVYDGLDGKESIIRSTPTFTETVSIIEDNNLMAPGSSVVFIPRTFTSKKDIVDMFIDDVAKKV